jgi:hypothetical protein
VQGRLRSHPLLNLPELNEDTDRRVERRALSEDELLRLLRAAVFTAVCVALSAAGHALASCEVLPLWALGVGAVISGDFFGWNFG